MWVDGIVCMRLGPFSRDYRTNKFLKISKQQTYKPLLTPYRSFSSVFMTNNTASGAKSIAKVPNQKVARGPKSFSSSSSSFFQASSASSSSDGLVQICVTLSRWLSHKTAALFTKQCTSSSFFHVRSHTRRFNRSLKNYGFIYDAIFFFACTHAYKSPSNEM